MKKLPANQKSLQGTLRKHRERKYEGATYEVLTEAPPAPSNLVGEHATKLWTTLTELLTSAGLLTSNDLPALQLLCETHNIRKRADEELATGELLVSPALKECGILAL